MIENRRDVMRSGAGFRMSLKAEGRFFPVMDSLQGTVKQGFVRCLQVIRQAFFIYGKAMVLGSNVNPALFKILHRMIGSMMAKFHLGSFGATGKGK